MITCLPLASWAGWFGSGSLEKPIRLPDDEITKIKISGQHGTLSVTEWLTPHSQAAADVAKWRSDWQYESEVSAAEVPCQQGAGIKG